MLHLCSSWEISAIEPVVMYDVYVVVNFLSRVILVFLLFLGIVKYANKVETKEKITNYKIYVLAFLHGTTVAFMICRKK